MQYYQKQTSLFKFLTFFTLIWFLVAACSIEEIDPDITDPDSGMQEEPTPAEVLTGRFIDSEVAGLTFKTPTKTGLTNANGEFSYLEGEEIEFSVGSLPIGTAIAKDIITPIDLIPESTVNTKQVKNIAALLQTLDSDGNPDNGISISTQTLQNISVDEIDYEKSIVNILSKIVEEVNTNTNENLTVVLPEIAAKHLARNVEGSYEIEDNNQYHLIPFVEHWWSYGAPNRFYWVHYTDESGKILESYQYRKFTNRLVTKTTYLTYNSDGLVTEYEIEDFFFFRNRKVTARYEYDENNIIKRDHRIQENSPNISYEFTFDEEWKTTDVKRIDENEQLLDTAVRTYDENGNRISNTITYTNGNPVLKTISNYLENGNFESTESFKDNESFRNRTFTYRENNSLEKSTSTIQIDDGQGGINIVMFEYEYDMMEFRSWSKFTNAQGAVTIRTFESGVITSDKNFSPEGILFSEIYYVNGIINLSKRYDSETGVLLDETSYNEMGQQLLTKFYTLEGELNQTFEYTYNDFDKVEKSVSYLYIDGEPSLFQTTIYRYDINQNIERVDYYDEFDTLRSYELYEYNTDNSYQIYFYENETLNRIDFYDQNDNYIRTEYPNAINNKMTSQRKGLTKPKWFLPNSHTAGVEEEQNMSGAID
ncbi:hypothetical protein ABN763_16940 [Spongiivirga sp. MCCC 1A20706]|uniref:hypothetical protein n=1 Tax=Spongiivirga sp. MCCC 1A20706 TaxID=3160963 RepID=UPI0039779284